MIWDKAFEKEYSKNPATTQQEFQVFLNTWNDDITDKELAEIDERLQSNACNWRFPKRNFPESYISFLQYSNGGEFENGDKYFQFFNIFEIRDINIAYHIPKYMEFAVSFAMDGNGNHYLFDMRHPPQSGEYPILAASSGNLGYDDCRLIGNSFLQVCSEKISIDEILFGE
ncbi:SMI1/KNR4 family protein [Acetivibrio cellulolyticus]|uniref:SMI1/KNR4 family protein n=1 Tax=Acetivibrio cellulolyticus TaxID=35830 RepID=UPI0001E2D558|nr:SMI1/KNR4 family protein [Acetivibrio cellulolyticus]